MKKITFLILTMSALLFSSMTLASKVNLTKPFVCPDVSPLPQHVTGSGDLVIEGKTYRLYRANAADPSAPLTTTIWRSDDGKTEVDIYQYKNGNFRQAFTTFAIENDRLPLSDVDSGKYTKVYKDSYSDGGRGCHN
ncbi:hypothetical protein [Morganella morganii]|uniref:hypothetical protein n=1 Tax=Morganella morganii TaxID=582 RepID=UPI000FDC75E9|nr:hypothetical protein [Morganella morganii]BEP20717.1 hypothetical protein SUGSMm_15140 [Morganella morganii subsp. sibonii]EKK5375533.1 hypothetical protein [Morganella morganii]ELB1546064.1 hypothetical protein [Morganella morganii]MBT0362584.1 hypothetical protein [Morganella morganii subsp. morganii]HDU8310039.1 hypothetical protein [Morganella morganii subsp. sibonii]